MDVLDQFTVCFGIDFSAAQILSIEIVYSHAKQCVMPKKRTLPTIEDTIVYCYARETNRTDRREYHCVRRCELNTSY